MSIIDDLYALYPKDPQGGVDYNKLGIGAFSDPDVLDRTVRSVLRAPATLPGQFADTANFLMELLHGAGGGKGTVRGVEKPIGGSQDLAERLHSVFPVIPTEPGDPNLDAIIGIAGAGPVTRAARLATKGAGKAGGAVLEELGKEPMQLDVAPGQEGAINPSKAQRVIDTTKKKGGATVDIASGNLVPERGNVVAQIGPRIGQSNVPQTTLTPDELTVKNLNRILDTDPRFKNADTFGTWFSKDDGLIYIDPVEITDSPFKTRLETNRRGQKASWNLDKMTEEYGGLDPGERAARAKAAAKNAALLEDVPFEPPPPTPYAEDPFWAWRVQHGGFKAENKGGPSAMDSKWEATKQMSESETQLQQAMQDAQKKMDAGDKQDMWDFSKLERPAQQNVPLNFAQRAKGIPQWIADQYGPGFEQYIKDNAIAVADQPDAWKFYWTGQLQKDYWKMLGKKAGQKAFEQFTANVGSTTSGSQPKVNARNASYYDARQEQGLPLPSSAPYPYGHNRAGTHLGTLEDLLNAGGEHIPEEAHPKPASFSGNLSGRSLPPTIDEVITEGHGLHRMDVTDPVSGEVTKKGGAVAAPFPGTYQAPVDAFDRIVADLQNDPRVPAEVRKGMLPGDPQSAAWANIGGDPEYSIPFLKHISDRINITAHVTGLSRQLVKELWMRKEIPLLGAGGFSLSDLSAPDELRQRLLGGGR